jgi:hypothetical protein
MWTLRRVADPFTDVDRFGEDHSFLVDARRIEEIVDEPCHPDHRSMAGAGLTVGFSDAVGDGRGRPGV